MTPLGWRGRPPAPGRRANVLVGRRRRHGVRSAGRRRRPPCRAAGAGVHPHGLAREPAPLAQAPSSATRRMPTSPTRPRRRRRPRTRATPRRSASSPIRPRRAGRLVEPIDADATPRTAPAAGAGAGRQYQEQRQRWRGTALTSGAWPRCQSWWSIGGRRQARSRPASSSTACSPQARISTSSGCPAAAGRRRRCGRPGRRRRRARRPSAARGAPGCRRRR